MTADTPDDARSARIEQIVARLKEIAAVFEALAEEAVFIADQLDDLSTDDDVIEVDIAHWHEGTGARN